MQSEPEESPRYSGSAPLALDLAIDNRCASAQFWL
jgi:hypothetical protein